VHFASFSHDLLKLTHLPLTAHHPSQKEGRRSSTARNSVSYVVYFASPVSQRGRGGRERLYGPLTLLCATAFFPRNPHRKKKEGGKGKEGSNLENLSVTNVISSIPKYALPLFSRRRRKWGGKRGGKGRRILLSLMLSVSFERLRATIASVRERGKRERLRTGVRRPMSSRRRGKVRSHFLPFHGADRAREKKKVRKRMRKRAEHRYGFYLARFAANEGKRRKKGGENLTSSYNSNSLNAFSICPFR